MKPPAAFRFVCLLAALVLAGCDTLQLGVETPASTVAVTATVAGPAATVAASATLPSVAETPVPSPTRPAAPTQPTVPSEQPVASLTPDEHSTVAPVDTPASTATQPPAIATTAVPGQPQVPDAILLLTPGNGGGVTSPVRVSGQADPTFEQNLVIKITDAEGTVLAVQATTIHSASADRGPFDAQVPFTVTADMPGRISVYSTSARDGGLLHLASADVTLLSGCCSEPIVGQPHPETHIIQEPALQASVSGGRLHVSGFSDYVFESQLALVLCGEGGQGAPDEICGTADNVLATGTARLNAPDVGQPGPFAGDLTFQVSGAVAGRLAVFSRSARDGGLLHLSTVPVMLAP